MKDRKKMSREERMAEREARRTARDTMTREEFRAWREGQRAKRREIDNGE